MRKQITGAALGTTEPSGGPWLDLESLAQVEVSSEAAGFPIEGALIPGSSRGWQAAAPGRADLLLRFDAPLAVAQVLLHCTDAEHERSQEWVLRARLADGSEREIVRGGWNFSPAGSTEQRELYTLQLREVRELSLSIDPDRGRDRYPATLAAWRVSSAT